MSELATELANILSAVVTQIRGLSDDEVKALAAGQAEFRLVPKPVVPNKVTPKQETPKKGTPKKETPKKETPKRASRVEPRTESTVDFEVAPVKTELAGCRTEAEALAYLQGLKLSLGSAKALATGLGLRLPARPSVSNIQAEIIRVFVGGRLNAVTVQGL